MSSKTQIDKYTDQIKNLTGNSPVITGGGKGWTASVDMPDATGVSDEGQSFILSNKGDSKEHALAGLLVAIAKGQTPDLETEGMTEAEVAKCVSECVESNQPYCECKCVGRNHGTGANGYITVKAALPVLLGEKPCACGCGETTLRRFKPGHDARFHAREKREKAAQTLGISVDDYLARQKADKQAGINKKAKARRAKRKGQQIAADARIAEIGVVAPAVPAGA